MNAVAKKVGNEISFLKSRFFEQRSHQDFCPTADRVSSVPKDKMSVE